MDLIHPASPADLCSDLRDASASGTSVLVVGGRRHMDRGNPVDVDAELWTTQLDTVIDVQPEEMIAVAQGGVRVGDLQSELAGHGQEWPVDAPPDATVGGVIAAAASSPRRLRVGHVRDSVLEMELVTGDGRLTKSGARTVKNVTGYDVHRLATGSLGSIGVIAQVAVKVRPLPKATRTLIVEGGVDIGLRCLEQIPLAAAVVARPERVEVRLEGWPTEIEEQTSLARSAGLDPTVSDDPELSPWLPEGQIVVEAAVAPSRICDLVAGRDRWTALMGIGTVWFALDDDLDRLAELRSDVAALGGIAPVISGPGGLGDAPIAAEDVQRRLKRSFDPAWILAPGRFWAGI